MVGAGYLDKWRGGAGMGGEYFTKVYLLRPKIKCNSPPFPPRLGSPHSRTSPTSGNAHQERAVSFISRGMKPVCLQATEEVTRASDCIVASALVPAGVMTL